MHATGATMLKLVAWSARSAVAGKREGDAQCWDTCRWNHGRRCNRCCEVTFRLQLLPSRVAFTTGEASGFRVRTEAGSKEDSCNPYPECGFVGSALFIYYKNRTSVHQTMENKKTINLLFLFLSYRKYSRFNADISAFDVDNPFNFYSITVCIVLP